MMAGQKRLRFTLCFLLLPVAALCFGGMIFRGADGGSQTGGNRADSLPAPLFDFPQRLRVGTYNLHNFRDENRFSEKGKFRYKHPKTQKEKAALYSTILDVRPDVLAVQEIGGTAWMEELAEALARRGLAFPYRVCLEGGDAYNRLAILSRVPFSKTVEISAPEKLSRGLLGVVIPVAGGHLLHVYNVHLKSKVSSDPDDPECNERRSREARYVRRLIELAVADEKRAAKIPASVRAPELGPKKTPELFLLLGDFNDVPGASSLSALEAESFAQALPAKNAAGGVLTYFNPHRGYFFTFDRIFASPSLFKKFYVPASAKIAEDSRSQIASDHRLVYADFDFSEKTPKKKKSSAGK